MLFNSLEFFAFFALVFAGYAVLGRRGQNRWLLVASYVFYAAWDWRFLGLIFLSTIVDYSVGLRLARSEDPRARRRLLTLSVATNLGILGTFKYAGFFTRSLADLLASLGWTVDLAVLDLVLPVGISFYTFQTLSYTIDIFRGELEPTRDFLDFALFVAFFPQLVAGPIERASRLLPQIAEDRRITLEKLESGSWLVLWGLFKKVVVGDNIAALVNGVYASGANPTGPEVLLATYGFAIQIYCDFSGYTDIARGVARMLGFELMLNFRLPYFALNPADFWRRWHISLSTWLRDYLYISLGGNRRGPRRTYVNLAMTMLLGGLWHGAAWNFVVWGGYQGLLLIVHRAIRGWLGRFRPEVGAGRVLWTFGSWILTFHLVCLGWLIFRAESFSQILFLLSRWTLPDLGLVAEWWLPFTLLAAPLVLMQLAQGISGDLQVVERAPLPVRSTIYAWLFLGIVFFGEDFGQPFIYFQF